KNNPQHREIPFPLRETARRSFQPEDGASRKRGKGGTAMTTTQHNKDIERFDHWSNTYEQSWMQQAFFDPVHRATLVLAAEIVPQPTSVLDAGCGTGKLLRQVRTRWPDAQLIGVDPAQGMIEIAQRLTPDASFFLGMAETLPL